MSVEEIKQHMLEETFRFESMEGRVIGWRDERGTYYINEGHHRINAALEIYWDTGDRSHLDKLLKLGKWEPWVSRRSWGLPTRTVSSYLLAIIWWRLSW
jgi:hypothetical protein